MGINKMKSTFWGMELSLDLYHCNPKYIRDEKKIKRFVIELCELIDMKRFGEPLIIRFGREPRVAGISMIQLIETSNISAHFADATNAAYINIFSCKEFNPTVAADFCKRFFKAKEAQQIVNYRV